MPTEETTQETTTEAVDTATPEVDNSSTTDVVEATTSETDSPAAETDAAASETVESKDEAEGTTDESAGVPESYEQFTMPEGVELDEAAFEQASAVFKKIGLTQSQAQELADLRAEQIASDSKAQYDRFETQKDTWETESRNDKEFGGDKFDESIANANLTLEKFGTPELNEVLTNYGLGNHPEVIRLLSRIGPLLKEDSIGGKIGVTGSKPKSKEERRLTAMYGESA